MKSGSNFKNFVNLIKKQDVIGIDTMPFIYYSEKNPKFGQISKTLFKTLAEYETLGITSTSSFTEVLSNKKVAKNKRLVNAYYKFFSGTSLVDSIPTTLSICKEAVKIRIKYKLKLPDAIQVATVKSEGATIFVTNDNVFKKLDSKKFKVLILSDFI